MPNESISLSPFEILYGSNWRGILDIYKELLTDKNLSGETKDAHSYMAELRERIVYSVMFAKQALEQPWEEHRFYANKKSKIITLESVDKVLILLPEKNNKLVIFWKRPFIVIKAVTNVD